MRLSKKGEYAVRALIEIGLESSRPGGHQLQIAHIAQRTNVPEKFLEQILLTLKNAGILKSKRGVEGGYSLNRTADAIMLGDIVRLMDGPLAPISCASSGGQIECNCPDPDTCGLRLAMRKVRDAIAQVLEGYSLTEVMQEVRQRQSSRSAALQFEI
jgi:Rrf2 family protein